MFRKIFAVILIVFVGYSAVLLIRSYQLHSELVAYSAQQIRSDTYLNYYYFSHRHCRDRCEQIELPEWVSIGADKLFTVDFSKVRSLGVENQKVFHPVNSALYSLGFYQNYRLTGQEKSLQIFEANANKLRGSIETDGCIELPFQKQFHNAVLEVGWCSALSQGMALSVLVRENLLREEISYDAQIALLLNPFSIDSDRSVVSLLSEGVFYEEYPLGTSSTQVLNGFLTSLFGLHDVFTYCDQFALNHDYCTTAYTLYENGILTFEKLASRYSTGAWSLYSLDEVSNLRNHYNLASPVYQSLHVLQLKTLCEIQQSRAACDLAPEFDTQLRTSYMNFVLIPAYYLYRDLVYAKRNIF